jgi:KRAB domain-containing zinc finger protein
MRVHQVEDPARCSYCQKNFLRMDCLVRHLRMKHREMLKQIIVDAETKKIRKTLGGEGNELEEVEIIYEPSNYLKNDAQISSSVDIIELVPQTTDDDDEATPIFLDDNLLEQRIAELLQIVIEESVLKDQGFRKKSIDEVLCSVLEKCCRTPLKKDSKEDDSTRLRENTKLLFTLVLDEDHIQTLLNNYTVDEVITIVIRMSK